jgi:hypothetical protein
MTERRLGISEMNGKGPIPSYPRLTDSVVPAKGQLWGIPVTLEWKTLEGSPMSLPKEVRVWLGCGLR